jgi:hypothetical protein
MTAGDRTSRGYSQASAPEPSISMSAINQIRFISTGSDSTMLF